MAGNSAPTHDFTVPRPQALERPASVTVTVWAVWAIGCCGIAGFGLQLTWNLVASLPINLTAPNIVQSAGALIVPAVSLIMLALLLRKGSGTLLGLTIVTIILAGLVAASGLSSSLREADGPLRLFLAAFSLAQGGAAALGLVALMVPASERWFAAMNAARSATDRRR